MARKRAQEEQVKDKIQAARKQLWYKKKKLMKLREKYTPVQEAVYTKRDPTPLVAQPTNPKVVECTIAGFPSAGKSALLCAMVGQKISASSVKVNTTIRPVVGVLTKDDTQVLITDTPGVDVIGRPVSGDLQVKEMAPGAWQALEENLVTLFVHDVRNGLTPRVEKLMQQLLDIRQAKMERRLALVLTHIDLVADTAKLALTKSAFQDRYRGSLDAIFPVDALRARGVNKIVNYLIKRAVPGMWLYAEGCSSNQSDVQLVDNIVREKVFRRFNRELPYQISNKTIGWTEIPNGSLRIDHALYVQRPTHARLVSSGLRVLHERALRDIEGVLQRNCYLNFHVVDKSTGSPNDRP